MTVPYKDPRLLLSLSSISITHRLCVVTYSGVEIEKYVLQQRKLKSETKAAPGLHSQPTLCTAQHAVCPEAHETLPRSHLCPRDSLCESGLQAWPFGEMALGILQPSWAQVMPSNGMIRFCTVDIRSTGAGTPFHSTSPFSYCVSLKQMQFRETAGKSDQDTDSFKSTCIGTLLERRSHRDARHALPSRIVP